jgi:hypothetical protein
VSWRFDGAKKRVTIMGRCALALLLIFLLLFAIADDLFASFTADPEDDVVAAADNVYLSGPATHDLAQQHDSPRPALDCVAPAPSATGATAAPAEAAGHLTAAPRSGAGRLYLFLSLRL